MSVKLGSFGHQKESIPILGEIPVHIRRFVVSETSAALIVGSSGVMEGSGMSIGTRSRVHIDCINRRYQLAFGYSGIVVCTVCFLAPGDAKSTSRCLW